MPRPDSVRILGFTYPVVLEASEDFSHLGNGEIDGDKQTIRIADGLGADKERETVLHEVLHGVSFAMVADLTEHQVKAVANGLYAVLRDNPDLVRYLTTDDT